MTPAQAQEILAAYRPGTADEHDPMFAEALAMTHTDAELRRWFQESLRFDQAVRVQVARVAAPSSVRAAILAERKIIRPVPWWQRRLNTRELAAAAVILVLGAVVALALGQRPATFNEFRREMVDQAWGPAPHVEAKVSSLDEVRNYLAAQNVSSNFTVTPTLAQAAVHGCSLLHWKGRLVPLICFSSEGKHVHLMVLDRNLFPDAPSQSPQVDQWDSWRTASWSKGDYTYVLTGLNTPGFVKKFRKDKRWDWEG